MTATDLSDAALEWHLRGNMYPPQPVELIPAIREAIEAMREGKPERLIALNRDYVAEHGGTIAWEPASLLIDNLRLEEFFEIETPEGWDEW